MRKYYKVIYDNVTNNYVKEHIPKKLVLHKIKMHGYNVIIHQQPTKNIFCLTLVCAGLAIGYPHYNCLKEAIEHVKYLSFVYKKQVMKDTLNKVKFKIKDAKWKE